MAKKSKARKAKATKKAATKKRGVAKGKGTMGFHVFGDERAKIKAKAKKLAGGNVSAWVRHAALNYDKPLRD